MGQRVIRRVRVIGCSALALLLGSWSVAAPEKLSDEELWAGAEARIEEHRKADAAVLVRNAAGEPVPDAQVQIEQTQHQFLFGCHIFGWGRFDSEEDERTYRQRFADLFNYATLRFFWHSYEREQNQPMHAYTEQVARWCHDHDIATLGHCLAWNWEDPPWLPDDLEEVRYLQMERIEDCVSRFRGLIDYWDVVNEATEFDRDEFWKRAPKITGVWEQVGQIEFARQCFRHARQADPEAKLMVNDYYTGPAYADVIDGLVDEKGHRLYDVIGIQSHMHDEETWSNRKIWRICERYARFGVPLHFTETTILSGKKGWYLADDGDPWPSTEEGERLQAEDVERFYTMLFSHPAVEAICWFDPTDRNSWQRAPAGLLREDLSLKPAYHRLRHLIKEKWWTRETLTTDSEGQARFRGLLGDYRVVVTAGGKTVETPMTLKKGAPNQLLVTVQ